MKINLSVSSKTESLMSDLASLAIIEVIEIATKYCMRFA